MRNDDRGACETAFGRHSRPLEGVTAAEAARIRFFEETEYDTELVTVTSPSGERIQARCHVDSTMDAYRNTPWELEVWQATEKRTFMILAHRWMEFFDSGNAAEADEEWDRIKAEIEAEIEAEQDKSMEGKR